MGPRRLIAAAVVAVGLVGCGSDETGGTRASEPPEPGDRAVVERVNDGDTLRTTNGVKVRLVQIDAPELDTDCYGRAALRALDALAPEGTTVRLVADPTLDDRDGYGRLLRYVFVGERNVNVELVRRGAASPYFFRKERGQYASALLAAVDDAREQHAGYWGACPDATLNPEVGSVTGPG